MSLLDTASLIVTPNGYKDGKLYSVIPSDGSGDMSVTRATTATRVNSAGLIESVANNIPRLDYSNGTCPSLLVEPQRTNIALQSSSFDSSTWSKNELTVSTNAFVSPSGIQDADKITPNTVNTFHTVQQVLSVSSGATYSFSIYAKASGYNYVVFNTGGSTAGNSGPIVNLSNGTIAGFFGSTDYNAQVEDVGNGWYRISFAFTTNSTSASVDINIFPTATVASYAGNGTSGCLFWGYQLEVGNYSTSYIPTTSASVTRNADVISKTGISSLIGQTEGTLFFDIVFPQDLSASYIGISDGTTGNRIILGCESGTFYTFGYGFSTLPLSINTPYKIAMAYNSTNMKIYANGSLIATISGSVPSGMSRFAFDSGANTQHLIASVKAAALWKTKLSDTQLAQLTTI